jgi:glycosyltransferase involved in cell wall biosynthesis
VGDGPERQRLEAAVAATGRGAECHFAGHREDPGPWYRLFDVYALSSDSEQLPMTLLEAMASQLPVAGTAVGDVPDALPAEQRGELVAPDRDAAPALSERLRGLVADDWRRRRLGALNRRRVEEAYSFAAMAGAYEEVYRAALEPGAAARWAPRRNA